VGTNTCGVLFEVCYMDGTVVYSLEIIRAVIRAMLRSLSLGRQYMSFKIIYTVCLREARIVQFVRGDLYPSCNAFSNAHICPKSTRYALPKVPPIFIHKSHQTPLNHSFHPSTPSATSLPTSRNQTLSSQASY
jgi:hypothetical protein